VAENHRTQARPNIHAVNAQRWAEEAVAWLGLQGWELVAVVQGEGPTFYFKRPLDDDTAVLEAERLADAAAGPVGNAERGPADDAGAPDIDPVRLIEEEFLPE
jgi:hypothetical protein